MSDKSPSRIPNRSGRTRPVLGLVVAVLLPAVLASPASAGPVGANGGIAFESRRAGDADVFLMRSDGTVERRLPASAAGASDGRPAWSPPSGLRVDDVAPTTDGRLSIVGSGFGAPADADRVSEVLFAGTPAAFEVVDGGQLIATPPAGADENTPVCVARPAGIHDSPELTVRESFDRFGTGAGRPAGEDCPSQPLAFQSDRTGDFDVWLTDPARPVGPGNPVNLTRRPGSHETAPAWSSSRAGQNSGAEAVQPRPLLAFESDRFGQRDIFVLDPSAPLSDDPSRPNPARVTTSPADDANPDFSPSGGFLTFESDRAGQKDIYVLTLARDTSGRLLSEVDVRKVTEDQPPSYDPNWYFFTNNGDPTDVSAIVFSGDEEGGGCELHWTVHEGGEQMPADPRANVTFTLPSGGAKEDSPVWSPIGSAIAFHSSRTGNDDIWRWEQDEAAEDPIPLTSDPASDRHPSWQPVFFTATVSIYRPWGKRTRRKPRPRAASAGVDRAKSAQVRASGCAEPPSAAFEATPATPGVGETVRFDAGASRDTDGPIVSYEWDFDGDGGFELATRQSAVTRSFASAGERRITLRVTDEDGASDRATRAVEVGGRRRIGSRVECTKLGTPADDVLRGTRRDDVLCGLGGDDLLVGLGGEDRLLGGAGGDRARSGRGRDRLRGGPGRDRLSGGAGGDRAHGGGGKDRLAGQGGGDRLRGGRGNDRLAGGGGGDALSGGGGKDTMRGARGRDRFAARDGKRDVVHGGRDRDTATVDAGVDQVSRVERLQSR